MTISNDAFSKTLYSHTVCALTSRHYHSLIVQFQCVLIYTLYTPAKIPTMSVHGTSTYTVLCKNLKFI